MHTATVSGGMAWGIRHSTWRHRMEDEEQKLEDYLLYLPCSYCVCCYFLKLMSCLALKHIWDRNPSYSNRIIEVEEVKFQRIYGKEKSKARARWVWWKHTVMPCAINRHRLQIWLLGVWKWKWTGKHDWRQIWNICEIKTQVFLTLKPKRNFSHG